MDGYFSGLKCYRKSVIKYLALYGDLYRFASVYAFKQGFRVCEVPVVHHHRFGGTSKYNFFSRMRVALGDLLTVFMTITFNQDRVYYMGFVGMFLLSIGVVFLFATFFLSQSITDYTQLGALKGVSLSMLFFGIQTLIFKKISFDFFSRHQDEREKRQRNVRMVLNHHQA